MKLSDGFIDKFLCETSLIHDMTMFDPCGKRYEAGNDDEDSRQIIRTKDEFQTTDNKDIRQSVIHFHGKNKTNEVNQNQCPQCHPELQSLKHARVHLVKIISAIPIKGSIFNT